MNTTIILSAIVGILVWQTITLIAFALTKENEDVGLYFGMGLPLILTQTFFGILRLIIRFINSKRYKRYEFVDTTARYCSTAWKFAKPKHMKDFNFDSTSTYYVIEHEMKKKQNVYRGDTLTPEQIENGFPGFPKDYLNKFKKGE